MGIVIAHAHIHRSRTNCLLNVDAAAMAKAALDSLFISGSGAEAREMSGTFDHPRTLTPTWYNTVSSWLLPRATISFSLSLCTLSFLHPRLGARAPITCNITDTRCIL